MFIADYMKAQVSIADEILLIQGDAAKTLYIISEGSVCIHLKESPIELFAQKIRNQIIVKDFKSKYLQMVRKNMKLHYDFNTYQN